MSKPAPIGGRGQTLTGGLKSPPFAKKSSFNASTDESRASAGGLWEWFEDHHRSGKKSSFAGSAPSLKKPAIGPNKTIMTGPKRKNFKSYGEKMYSMITKCDRLWRQEGIFIARWSDDGTAFIFEENEGFKRMLKKFDICESNDIRAAVRNMNAYDFKIEQCEGREEQVTRIASHSFFNRDNTKGLGQIKRKKKNEVAKKRKAEAAAEPAVMMNTGTMQKQLDALTQDMNRRNQDMNKMMEMLRTICANNSGANSASSRRMGGQQQRLDVDLDLDSLFDVAAPTEAATQEGGAEGGGLQWNGTGGEEVVGANYSPCQPGQQERTEGEGAGGEGVPGEQTGLQGHHEEPAQLRQTVQPRQHTEPVVGAPPPIDALNLDNQHFSSLTPLSPIAGGADPSTYERNEPVEGGVQDDAVAPPAGMVPGRGVQQPPDGDRLACLEDDDPAARLASVMEKCSQILKLLIDKDAQDWSFFAEPVDPVALDIPTYPQIITDPMDLGTIQERMHAGEIKSPEVFSRLVRLVFENAMTFNVSKTHKVHQTAASLLNLFNHKFRDVERMMEKEQKEANHPLPIDTLNHDAPILGTHQQQPPASLIAGGADPSSYVGNEPVEGGVQVEAVAHLAGKVPGLGVQQQASGASEVNMEPSSEGPHGMDEKESDDEESANRHQEEQEHDNLLHNLAIAVSANSLNVLEKEEQEHNNRLYKLSIAVPANSLNVLDNHGTKIAFLGSAVQKQLSLGISESAGRKRSRSAITTSRSPQTVSVSISESADKKRNKINPDVGDLVARKTLFSEGPHGDGSTGSLETASLSSEASPDVGDFDALDWRKIASFCK